MKSIVSVLLAYFFFNSFLFSQDIIKSNFDTDADGWSVNGGNLYHHNSNGNPDGFIEFEDNQDGKGIFIAPNKFLGNLLLYKLGTLEFDLKNTYNNGQNMLWGFGMVKLSSSTHSAEEIVVPLEYINDWTTFSIPLNHNDWGMTETGWDSLLAEVTEISLQMDAQWDYYDRVGLDNFSILPFSSDVKDGSPNDKFFSYQLYQNYPNPFNPNTVISYQLPVSSNVMLKVYDILGKEIATLVDEYQSAGRYEVQFIPIPSIKNLASGIYIYQLRAGSFVQTKKMIILR